MPHSLGRFRFQHALIRETLYAEHTTVHRATLHRQIGELLEAAYADDLEPYLSQLAYHYFEAAQTGEIEKIDKAVTYTLRAGQRALAMLAYDEAATNFALALQVLELEQESDTERRFRLLSALGDAQNKAGYLNESTQTLLSAASLAIRKEWWPLLAETVITFQIVLCKMGSSHPAVVPMHESALQHLPKTASALRARLLASLSDALHYTGEYNRAETVAREGLEIARSLDDPEVLSFCLNLMSYTEGLRLDGSQLSLDLAQEAFALAQHQGQPEVALEAMNSLCWERAKLGRIGELKHQLSTFINMAEQTRQSHFLYLALGWQTSVAILEGRWQDALAGAQEGLRLGPASEAEGLEGSFSFQMFAIQRPRGELRELAAVIEHFTAETSSSQLWSPGLTLVYADLDKLHKARAIFEALAKDDFKSLAKDDLYLTSLLFLAEACHYLQDTKRAALLYERLKPYRNLNASLMGTVMYGAVARYLALLATVLKRRGEAKSLFEAALGMNANMGARPALAQTQYDYACFLLLRGNLDDEKRARVLLTDSQRIAEDIDLHPLLAKIQVLQEADFAGAERHFSDNL